MKRLILFILCSFTLVYSQTFRGRVSSGIYMGMPFWNNDNTAAVIDSSDSFIRSVNQFYLQGVFNGGFKVVLSALRSDGFQSDNRLSETKIYSLYGQYDFSRGNIQAGRITPFMRWIHGSVDGAAVRVSVNDWLSLNVLAGLQAPYGMVFTTDTTQRRLYGHVQITFGRTRLKLKVYNDEAQTKAGADIYGLMGKLRYTANYGFDFSASRLSDGGLSLFYPLSKRLTTQISYRLFWTRPWILGHIYFESYMIERLWAGIHYRVTQNLVFNYNQMVTLTSQNTDYLSMCTLSYGFIQAGVNYLTGSSDIQRLGLVLGAHYRFLKNLTVSGGIAPVDYLYQNQDEHIQSVAYYLHMRYRFLKQFVADANLNFYHNNEVLNSPLRGGIRLIYYFGS